MSVSKFSSSYKDTSHIWIRAHLNDLILTWLHLWRPYFQIRSYSHIPGIRTATYLLVGTQFNHSTHNTLCHLCLVVVWVQISPQIWLTISLIIHILKVLINYKNYLFKMKCHYFEETSALTRMLTYIHTWFLSLSPLSFTSFFRDLITNYNTHFEVSYICIQE